MIRRLAAATSLACIPVAPALAGPPYVTDDPEPADLGKWEIYAFHEGTHFRRAGEGESGLDINYGAAPDLQASATISFDDVHGGGDGSHVGFGDLELGLKYRFLHQRDGSWMPDVSLYPQVALPTAGHRFGSGRVGLAIPVWAQKDFGGWSLFGGGGYVLNPGAGNRDHAIAGLALTRDIGERFSLGAEIHHQTADERGGESTTGIGLGAELAIAPHWSLIGSGGPVVQHRASGGRYAFYVALAFHN